MIYSKFKQICIYTLFFFIFFGENCLAQSPYGFNKNNQIAILGVGSVSLGTSLILRSQVDLLTENEIIDLDRNRVNSFDRQATLNSSVLAAKQSDVFLYGSCGIPLLLMASSKINTDLLTMAVLWGEVVLLNGGLTLVSKYSSQRIRPFVYNPDFSLEEKQELNAKTSFFSGHSSMVAANTFFAAKVFSDYYPKSKWKPLIWSLAVVIPVTTAHLRVAAGKHFPTDVITGCLIGAACGYFIPAIHKKQGNNNSEIVFLTDTQRITILYNF